MGRSAVTLLPRSVADVARKRRREEEQAPDAASDDYRPPATKGKRLKLVSRRDAEQERQIAEAAAAATNGNSAEPRPGRRRRARRDESPAPAPSPAPAAQGRGGTTASAGEREAQKQVRPAGGKKRREVLLVGIAGPSGAGKSTLATKLVQELDCPLKPVSMDWFLVPEWMPKDTEAGGRNWETPSGVDFPRLLRELRQAAEAIATAEQVPAELPLGGKFGMDIVREGHAGRPLGPEPVFMFVEGFLLFYDAEVTSALHLHFWLETDCETCLLRRFRRGKKKGKDVEKTRAWFNRQVWVEYEANRGQQLRNAASALRLDASAERGEIMEQAIVHCRKLLESRRGKAEAEAGQTSAKRRKKRHESWDGWEEEQGANEEWQGWWQDRGDAEVNGRGAGRRKRK